MELLKKIEQDMAGAMKSKDELRAQTLKTLKADIMYEKAKTGKDLTDEKIQEIIARSGKRRKEAASEYRKGNREDLAQKEESEFEIIAAYLPEQMDEAEVEKHIDTVIAESGAASKKEFGKVMGMVMKDLKGKVDGNIVKSILNKKLQD